LLDIALLHGESYLEVMKIVWHMVEVINRVPELAIEFPESHEAQLQVANGFKKLVKPASTTALVVLMEY
jgi:hypothetical protein